jgi:transcription elongation factor GreA
MLKNVVILDESEIVKDVISLGSNVKVYDEEFEEELEYVIVGSTEADLDLGKISDESPVGKALIGKKVGEVAEAILPGGDTAKFKVISIG